MIPATDNLASKSPGPRRRWPRRAVHAAVITLVVYLALAYIVLPALWRHYDHHPGLALAPKTTQTRNDIPGDPLNVAVIGQQHEVVKALLLAHWFPADPTTLRTSLRIAESVVFDREYKTAPVSNLYLFGRRQDLAFEKPATRSPRKRNHVRLWRSTDRGSDGRPLWLGAATFDTSVGVSHYTGQVTHHIAPDVDAERDDLMGDLANAGQLVRLYQVTGVGPTLAGRNGGGDWYYTDGEMDVGVISPNNLRRGQPPEILPNPRSVALKNTVWSWLRPYLSETEEQESPAVDPSDVKSTP
jgi:hypothetical protein